MAKAGVLISNLSGEAEYKSYRPAALPPEIEIDTDIPELDWRGRKYAENSTIYPALSGRYDPGNVRS